MRDQSATNPTRLFTWVTYRQGGKITPPLVEGKDFIPPQIDRSQPYQRLVSIRYEQDTVTCIHCGQESSLRTTIHFSGGLVYWLWAACSLLLLPEQPEEPSNPTDCGVIHVDDLTEVANRIFNGGMSREEALLQDRQIFHHLGFGCHRCETQLQGLIQAFAEIAREYAEWDAQQGESSSS